MMNIINDWTEYNQKMAMNEIKMKMKKKIIGQWRKENNGEMKKMNNNGNSNMWNE